MKRAYEVQFNTQKDRRYITWTVFVSANNQTEAKDIARNLWHSNDNEHQRSKRWSGILGRYMYEHPHMFHLSAKRVSGELDEDFPLNKFCAIDNKAVTWGYRR